MERVFIDPGNLLRNGLAISQEFFKKSGLRLVERQNTFCNTAKKAKSGALFQLGIASPLSLRLPGISKVLFVEKPVVLQGLCDSLNLGMGCLQKLEADMQFRKNGTRLVCREDEVNLIAGLGGNGGEWVKSGVDAPSGQPKLDQCNNTEAMKAEIGSLATGKCVANGLGPSPTAKIISALQGLARPE